MHIARLRDATAADHATVEGTMTVMSPALTREEYRVALERMYGLVALWERALAVAAPPEWQTLVAARAREALLASDVVDLGGHAAPTCDAILPEMRTRAALLGAMYVMEGSRLGGQFIARHVTERLALVGDHGTRYFRGFGEQTGSMWRELLVLIEQDVPDDDEGQVIETAKAMFQTFGSWMRHEVVTVQPRDASFRMELPHD